MGRTHVKPLLGFHVHPAAGNPPARKNQRVRTIKVDHGELQIAFKWRSRNGFPHF